MSKAENLAIICISGHFTQTAYSCSKVRENRLYVSNFELELFYFLLNNLGFHIFKKRSAGAWRELYVIFS